MNRLFYSPGAVLVCLVAALGAGGCHKGVAADRPVVKVTAQKPVAQESVAAADSVWPTMVRTQGTLAADEQSVVGAKVAGRVAETFVELGMVVAQAEPLARLEMSDFDLRIQQAQAQLAEACAAVGLSPDDPTNEINPEAIPFVIVEKTIWEEALEALDRLRRLQQNNAVSKSEYDKQLALARVASARHQSALRSVDEKVALIRTRRVELSQARQSKADATIVAPFDGVIQERHLTVGNFVQIGAPVVTMVRIDPLRFQGRVPETRATSVRVGQPIVIQIEGETAPVVSEVVRVSPALDVASRSLHIEAEIANPTRRLRSGLFAEGWVEVDPLATTLALPASAVGEFAGVHKVWVVAEQGVQPRRIEIGRTSEQRVEILAGLSAGEQVLRFYAAGDVRPTFDLSNNE